MCTFRPCLSFVSNWNLYFDSYLALNMLSWRLCLISEGYTYKISLVVNFFFKICRMWEPLSTLIENVGLYLNIKDAVGRSLVFGIYVDIWRGLNKPIMHREAMVWRSENCFLVLYWLWSACLKPLLVAVFYNFVYQVFAKCK